MSGSFKAIHHVAESFEPLGDFKMYTISPATFPFSVGGNVDVRMTPEVGKVMDQSTVVSIE